MKTIIDLSYANGTVDFTKMRSINTPFVDGIYIKINEGFGTKYIDTQLKNNVEGCIKNKYLFGYYHFATLNTDLDPIGDAKSEADFFIEILKTLPAYSMIPVIDIETNSGKLTKEHVVAWMNTFFSELKNAGHPDFRIYGSKGFLDANLPSDHHFENIKLWVAHYTNQSKPLMPNGWPKWDLWQYSSEGKIPGVNKNVDLSRTSE